LLVVVMAMAMAVGGWGLVQPRVHAHEGPEHVIEDLDVRIRLEGETADLRVARAVELVLVGRMADALRDLERAVLLAPESRDALRELARLQFAMGQVKSADATLTRAVGVRGGGGVDRGGVLMLRAEVRASVGRVRAALADCEAAIRGHPGHPEWYLFRSELQRRLGRNRSRLAGIERGLAETGSGLLLVERVEVLLDLGHAAEALAIVDRELGMSRVRGRWLVRRGRALLGLGRRVEGEGVLRAAVGELETLFDPVRPDVSLLEDQAVAWWALGDQEAVRGCLERVRSAGGDRGALERIGQLERKKWHRQPTRR
jgi:tetratricopeptide (TPR) repeat protein